MTDFNIADLCWLAVLLVLIAIQSYRIVKNADKFDESAKSMSAKEYRNFWKYDYFTKKLLHRNDLFI